MDERTLFERDLLYPTENRFEPGCIHVQINKPNKLNSIPIVIESKTTHFPANYIDAIVRIIQSDILDRIFVDIKKNVSLYILNQEDAANDFAGSKYIKVLFNGDRICLEAVDELED